MSQLLDYNDDGDRCQCGQRYSVHDDGECEDFHRRPVTLQDLEKESLQCKQWQEERARQWPIRLQRMVDRERARGNLWLSLMNYVKTWARQKRN